jgi:hypothetical protein
MELERCHQHDLCWQSFQVYNLIINVNLTGSEMGTITKSVTSNFQHDDIVTLNAQVHGHRFKDIVSILVAECGI